MNFRKVIYGLLALAGIGIFLSTFMQEPGSREVYSMKGNLISWERDNNPLVRP